MKFPGEPRPKKSPAAAGRRTPWQRTGLFLLGASALFLVSFFSGVYLFFPAEALKQRIIQTVAQNSGAEVRIESLALYPLLTFEAEQVNLATQNIPWPLEVEELQISPRWLSLLSKDPGAQIKARLMGGTVTSAWQKSGLISVQAQGLRFDLPLQEPLALQIVGTLDEADLDSGVRLDTDTQTQLALQLSDVSILGLDLAGDGETQIGLGQISLRLAGQGRSIQINSLTAQGGDFDVDGEGSVIIGRTAATSRLRLTLLIRPGPDIDPSLNSLLELTGKPAADGRFPLRITGSLAKPVLNL